MREPLGLLTLYLADRRPRDHAPSWPWQNCVWLAFPLRPQPLPRWSLPLPRPASLRCLPLPLARLPTFPACGQTAWLEWPRWAGRLLRLHSLGWLLQPANGRARLSFDLRSYSPCGAFLPGPDVSLAGYLVSR